MYSAALLFIWASVAGHANAWTVTLAAAVTVLAVARVRAEERLLRTKYAVCLANIRTAVNHPHGAATTLTTKPGRRPRSIV